MAVAFPNLNTEAGLKHLDEYLLSRTFITGHQATRDDIAVYGAISKVLGPNFPNVSRWYNHINAFLASSFPGEAIGVQIEGAAPSAAPVTETTAELLGLLRLNKEDAGEIGWKNRVLAVVPALRRAWDYIISHRFIRPQSQCMYSTGSTLLPLSIPPVLFWT